MARLTIPDEDTFAEFTVTTPTNEFPITFALFAKADLTAKIGGTALEQSDFSFSGTLLDGGGYAGGTVILNDPVDDTVVRIERNVAPTRTSQFAPASTVPVGSVDQALNRVVATQQDHDRRLTDAEALIDDAQAAAGSASAAAASALIAQAAANTVLGQKEFTSFVVVGDSIAAGAGDGSSWPYRYVNLSGKRYMVANYAIGGYTSQGVIDDQLEDACASGASHCFAMFGANDIAQGVSFATLKANALTIWGALRGAGVQPIVVGLPTTSVAANYKRFAAFNLWARSYCRAENILYIDVMPWLSSSGAGGFKTGVGIPDDVIHPSSVGARLIALRAEAQTGQPYAVTAPLAEADDRTFDGWVTFPAMQNNAVTMTDTNADGVPNEFFTLGSGGTYSIQAADADGFGKWARCAISAGTSVGITTTGYTMASLGWEVGHTIAIAFRIRWVDVDQALKINARFTGINGGNDVYCLYDEQGGTPTGDDMTVYKEFVITEGTGIGFLWVGTGTGYFEINRPQIFNLTKMGLA